ncbi:MAG TPA: dienelactone hydrolase family protein [Geobacterales bacterium]|nr:dienelactone hydrolase family protein [Geobacterales bacterium]
MESESKFLSYDRSEIEVFISQPKDYKAAIIVIHEIWGLTDYIKNVARRLSNESFLVLAPNLYSRKKEVFTQSNIFSVMKRLWSLSPASRRNKRNIEKLYAELNDSEKIIFEKLVTNREKAEEEMVKDLSSIYKLIKENYAPMKIGVIGFCMGGGLAFQFSTIEEINASVIYYGHAPRPLDNIKNLKGAVLGIYAGNDTAINKELPDLIRKMVKYQINFEVKLYPYTNHAFATEGGLNYNEDAAKDAWQRTISFFKKYLN